ncbi:glycosyltransferase family protein [Aestuariibaculum lutulentum]|uniref:Glycosyltransferase family 4 protein n=1 Tax=Aestuariibaculum lutulentum TaxID=2920935 RepID=A0ABS9RE63_9FLAO|nr:hypothetical protein [Aestuariibaculum lutulentum]MCH4551236.1 hypothetical protein [Aestuariibaculum lutulentum]
MKFLIIAQDLRVSGTSEGVVSRSFVAKLKTAYPQCVIDVMYLRHGTNEDALNLLPVNHIEVYNINRKVPFYMKWVNKVYWRICHKSLNEWYIQNKYKTIISKISYKAYDHIFMRSCGLQFEAILAIKNLPILKKTYINFHDPYPVFWCAGSNNKLNNLELFRLKQMNQVVSNSKGCISPAKILSNDLEVLYGSRKPFKVLPHQYDKNVFDFSDTSRVRKKTKKVTISYHGILQFGRNIDILLDAYLNLISGSPLYKENTEFLLRIKGKQAKRLKNKYVDCENIILLEPLNFSNAAIEQETVSDILIILENGPLKSNILVGKAPFIASLNKPILCLSPKVSELRGIIKEDQFIADCDDESQIKNKLENLIENRLRLNEPLYPFGDYFSDANFKKMLNTVLEA